MEFKFSDIYIWNSNF